MQPQEWRQKLGDCVRDLFLSPEMQHFYSIEMTIERARIYLLQLGIYVRQRRNFWPQVAANCPEFEVKQRIMEHEHEELVEDEHSKAGHLDLIFRQGKELGLSVEQVLEARALPTTKAAIYGWFWIALIGRGRRRSPLRRLPNGPTMIACWATSAVVIAPGFTKSGSGI